MSVPNLIGDTRWGAYPTHALAQEVRSSLPFTVDETTVGALNLYNVHPDAIIPDLARDASLLAAGVAGRIGVTGQVV